MPKLPKLAMPVFSDDDVLRLLAACDTHRDRAMVLFLLDTGVRVAEMVALNVGDVDMESGTVLVEQGKGQKDRTVYVSPRTLKQVMRFSVRTLSGVAGITSVAVSQTKRTAFDQRSYAVHAQAGQAGRRLTMHNPYVPALLGREMPEKRHGCLRPPAAGRRSSIGVTSPPNSHHGVGLIGIPLVG